MVTCLVECEVVEEEDGEVVSLGALVVLQQVAMVAEGVAIDLGAQKRQHAALVQLMMMTMTTIMMMMMMMTGTSVQSNGEREE